MRWRAVQRAGADRADPLRDPGDRITPVNISKEKVSGVIAGTTYRWGGGRAATSN